MIDLLLVPVAILYMLVVGALFLYGVNFFYLCLLTWTHRKIYSPGTLESNASDLPHVTVQLPIYNERYVAQRLIEAAACLDYPRHLLEIQVLDDSSDETHTIVQGVVARLRAQGVDICHLHRQQRQGYKAGALAQGLALSSGEYLAIFDADFLPPPDFLLRTLPAFDHHRVAFVQARWGHINREYSLLTNLQSLSIDAHFVVEQYARSREGYWFNFNGTAGIWRKTAIEDAGGWKSDTLTEDLDLSYRAFLNGWEARYLRDVETPAELPVSFSAYRRQQHRWARGSMECANRFLPQIWQATIPFRQKFGASLHLTSYYVHVLLFALMLLYPAVLLLTQRYQNLIGLFGVGFFFNATAFAPTIFFAVAQQQLGRRWWRLIPKILFMTVLGAGMMLNTLRAALQIGLGKANAFERTPKYGIVQPRQDWLGLRYQMHLDPLVYLEAAFAIFNLGTALFAWHLGNWIIAIYASLFSLGLFFTSSLTIYQSLAITRRRKAS
jgi:cellulose synthase/poly-beta-1,6-N-acetylglucosamine synthase-like glycosyltransferase